MGHLTRSAEGQVLERTFRFASGCGAIVAIGFACSPAMSREHEVLALLDEARP